MEDLFLKNLEYVKRTLLTKKLRISVDCIKEKQWEKHNETISRQQTLTCSNLTIETLQSVTKIMGKTAIWAISCSTPFPLLTMLRNNE